jgi:ankyrin repeat protein
MSNDAPMVEKQWTRPRDYLTLRNYKYETIFHIAAKYNSLECLQTLIKVKSTVKGGEKMVVFLPHMLKKDYEGNTAIHVAAKTGSIEILEFFLSSVTPGFLEICNDFGFTALQSC